MGTLIPRDLSVRSLPNEAERRVVEAFRDGLSDAWLIIPNVAIRGPQRDYEIDVVLLHSTYGVVVVEVKGHDVDIREGRWYSHGSPMEPQPLDQARTNAYALRDLIRAELPDLQHLRVEYGVALPNTSAIEGRLPPGFSEVQVATAPRLDDVSEFVEVLAFSRWTSGSLTPAHIEAIVAILSPDAKLVWDAGARMRSARERLDEQCSSQIKALETLDANRRVVVLGRAGTGKTRLAMAWARRAWRDDQRVLLTCYNEPLAERIAADMAVDESLVIGPFLRLALTFDGMPSIEVPEAADHDWWTVTAVGHLHAHWHLITERFDTIIVDEAQDFSPAWLAQLASLLDPDGPRGLLIVADPTQELYARGFQIPSVDDGWTQCELVNNCRNADEIGALLRRRLGGAAAPMWGPEAIDVRLVATADGVSVAPLVDAEIERLVLDSERDPSQIAVLTTTSRLRDELVERLALRRWEDRDDRILCENVHRVKGLEFDTVILVADAGASDDLLYVGISRAVSELVIVAPTIVGERLALTPADPPELARPAPAATYDSA